MKYRIIVIVCLLSVVVLSGQARKFDISAIQTDQKVFCVNTEQTFSVDVSDISKTEWYFGDGSAVETDTNSGTQTHPHTYAKPGTYTIVVRYFKSDGSEATTERKTLEVTVNPCAIPVNPNRHLY